MARDPGLLTGSELAATRPEELSTSTRDQAVQQSRAVVEITGLGRRFGDHEVVSSLDLSLAPGERVAFWGPNGSGKSTVLRCIAGTLFPSRGRDPRERISGRDARGPPGGRCLARAGAVLLPSADRTREPAVLRPSALRFRARSRHVASALSRRSSSSRTSPPSVWTAARRAWCSSSGSPGRSSAIPPWSCSTSPRGRSTRRPAAASGPRSNAVPRSPP